MTQLSAEHIEFIIKDLHRRGLVLDTLIDEVIDHVCSGVEDKMATGMRFADAYKLVVDAFGADQGIESTQRETLHFENHKPKNMLRNYLTVAFRNLAKHRFYTFINIGGLAIGVAACLLIALFVVNELQYDKHYDNADRIYRIHTEIKFGDNHYRLAVAPAPMAEALLAEYPEVEAAVRFRSRGSYLVKREASGDNIKENNVMWVDSTFFEVFSVPVIEGDPKRALIQPNDIAISQKMAEKFFPGGDALGQTLILDNDRPMKVTAVFANMPKTGHFFFDILIAMSGLGEAQEPNFLSNNFNTYVRLQAGTDPKAFEQKLRGFVIKFVGPQAAQALGDDFDIEKFEAAGNIFEFTVMPLTDIHLHSNLTAEIRANGNITYVYLFLAIALFILAIACINFMNLSTARSSNRAKEVGVRKVMGSLRSHLVRQFLTESTLLTIGSFILAVGIAYAMVPLFNELVQKELSLPFSSGFFYVILLLAAVIIGIMAGLYPSFFLSAFKPVNVLKGQFSLGMKSGLIRSALVVFQFVISIFLVIGTVTVYRQLNYIQNKKIGFEKDQVILIQDAYALQDQAQAFKEEVKRFSFIQNGTRSGYLPVDSWRSDQTYWPEGSQPTQETMVGIQTWGVDHDYLNTLGMHMKLGRFFSPEFPSDSTAVVINESAVIHFNFTGDPLGQRISSFSDLLPSGAPDPNSLVTYTVIGVVEDFHFASMKENISPLAFFLRPNSGTMAFRFQAGDVHTVIDAIETKWKAMAPGQPFQYTFLDEAFNRMYDNEQRLGKTFSIFAGLAIIIACLGLFALTAFTAEQRAKEIGIRKVLGASVSSIIMLLSREFGKLILIAFVLAAPAAWFAVNWWLKDYTYKVEIGVMVYLLAGVISFAIAWLTMGYQSVRAATANPVQSLRSE